MRIDEKVCFWGMSFWVWNRGGIWRGWIVPVGGSTPDRLRGDRLGPVRDGGEEMRIDEKVCFGVCVSGFGIAGETWRGWIVPVGGLTPDRLRSDRIGPAQDGGEEMRIDEKVCFGGCVSGFGIAGDIWRGWIVPVGGSTPDRHRTGSGAIGSDRFGTGERK